MRLSRTSSILLLGVLIAAGLFLDFRLHPITSSRTEYQYPEPQIQIPATTSCPPPLSLHAKYACVMDADSGRPLYTKDAARKVPMASTTKIMTALLVLESPHRNDIVTVSKKAASMPKVRLGMRAGMQYRMSDLLYSLLLESHNDTAVAIAEHIGRSVEGFASLMNRKAKAVGMRQTHFVTPNGLDAAGHYSTAEDMCRLAGYAIKNKDFLSYVQAKSHSFTDVSGRHSYSLSNKDAFLSYYDGALGIKTGFTGKAGYCFVGAAARPQATLTSCVLACGWPPNKSYKWTDTKKLMDYGMQHFSRTEFPVQDLTKARIPVADGKKDSVSLSAVSKPPVLASRFDSFTVVCQIPQALYAPVRKGTPVGKVRFYINRTLYGEENIFPAENIEKSGFSDTMEKVLHIWMEIFGISEQ